MLTDHVCLPITECSLHESKEVSESWGTLSWKITFYMNSHPPVQISCFFFHWHQRYVNIYTSICGTDIWSSCIWNASNIISNTKYILLTAVNLQIKKSALKGILPTKKIILFTLDSVSSFQVNSSLEGKIINKKHLQFQPVPSQEPIIRFQKTGTVLYYKKPPSKLTRQLKRLHVPVLNYLLNCCLV